MLKAEGEKELVYRKQREIRNQCVESGGIERTSVLKVEGEKEPVC
jgi:hypothetical protein